MTCDHVTDYPDNEEPLTPNHFHFHRPYANLHRGVFQDFSHQLTQESWKETPKLFNHLWKRLVTEYISTLKHRFKGNQKLQQSLLENLCGCYETSLLVRFGLLGEWKLFSLSEINRPECVL